MSLAGGEQAASRKPQLEHAAVPVEAFRNLRAVRSVEKPGETAH